MITTVTIKNFQSHANSILRFHKGVNVIIGQSDSGKSSIVRALNFVLLNKARGSSYIKHGTSKCSVSVDINKHNLVRNKGAKCNDFMLDGNTFKGVNTEIPKEIKKAANITDINICGQFEPHFLLSLSNGEMAKKLNQIVNLGDIDAILSNINKQIKDTTQKQTYENERITKHSKELNSFGDLLRKQRALQHIYRLNEKLACLKTTYRNLSLVTQKTIKTSQRLAKRSKLNISIKVMNELITKTKNKEQLIRRHEKLCSLLSTIRTKQSKLASKCIDIQTYKELLKANINEVCPLCGQNITLND